MHEKKDPASQDHFCVFKRVSETVNEFKGKSKEGGIMRRNTC